MREAAWATVPPLVLTSYFYFFMDVVNNKKQFRFESQLPDGEYITLEYRWLKGSMALMHTWVPATARHTGMGTTFIQKVLDYLREANLKIIPYCPFVGQFIKEHPDYADMIDEAHRKQ